MTPAAPEAVSSDAAGADPSRLGPYLSEVLGPGWRWPQVELIPGGRSNLTYVIASGGKELVLRRPPLGHVLPTAHDMAREFKVISALQSTDVPVPDPLHLCEDESVIGAPFYLMSRCDGLVLRNRLPAGYADSPAERVRLGNAVVDVLVSLHAIDWAAAGLSEFGRPEGFMARQIKRWRQQWERSATRSMHEMDALADELEKRVPKSGHGTIVHGDYRIDNLILHREDPGRIVAVLDWEMSTIGDPLADLGMFLVYWSDPEDNPVFREAFRDISVSGEGGFPTRREVVERYAARSGRDVSNAAYYWAFGFFKIAVILEGIHARYLQGKTVGPGFETFGERVAPLVALASAVLDKGEVGPL